MRNGRPERVRLVDVSSDEPALQVKLQEQIEGRLYLISVGIPQGYLPPAAGRLLTIKTENPKLPPLQIPVVATQPARSLEHRRGDGIPASAPQAEHP